LSRESGLRLTKVKQRRCRLASIVARRSYEAGGKREFVAFATAVEGFCDFYFRHMRKEETLAMPLADKLFSKEEWGRIDAACAAARETRGGMDEEREFRHLFRRIIASGPARRGAPVQ
jgi:hemerythrin-like domain-containing protein